MLIKRILFDTAKFEEWVLDSEPSDYYPSFGNWDKSPLSNSLYCTVSVSLDGEDGEVHDIDLTLRVSDHSSFTVADIVVDDMPQSQEFRGIGWRNRKGASWNSMRSWRKIIKAIDAHCDSLCVRCELPRTNCICEEE